MIKSVMEDIYSIGTLQKTLEMKKIDNHSIPFQNGVPYPSFEPQHRKVLSLSGTWKKQRFEADHEQTMSKRDAQWLESIEKDTKGVTKIAFDDSSWENHELPLPENALTGKAEVNGAETYENGVWYRKMIHLDSSWSNTVVSLKCLGLSYIGDFWINGEYVGHHEGGFTPFAFDVTSFMKHGDNTIAIRVDNPPWTSRIDILPAVDNDFFNYTGVIQELYLEAVTSVQIARADVVSTNINGNIKVTAVIENRTGGLQCITVKGSVYGTDFNDADWLADPSAKSICKTEIETAGLDTRQVNLSPHEAKVISYDICMKEPKLWSIGNPNLYVLELTLFNQQEEVDSFYSQFGIRTVATKEAKILLNETPVFLAGVARHEEWPSYGRTASWERIKSDFHQIKELFVNMVRTAHYPNHIYTYIMLDRLGLTAMSEIPLWQFETHHYEAQEERGVSYQMWREMIFSQYNRPSVIMWSTQNESKDVQLRKQYNEKLVNEVRNEYNDGRLITQSAAADQPGAYDESMECLDVAGWTMYFGIFHGSTPYEGTRDFLEKVHERWPDKPIMNTEYGIWSNADESFIEKQVEIYRDVQHALLEKATVAPSGTVNENGYLAVMDYWTVYDWYVNHNRFYQTMGMYQMDRVGKKPLYHHFVLDHRRLIGQTQGMGIANKGAVREELQVVQQPDDRSIHLSFTEPQDLREWNYLSLKVMDSESSDGFSVQISDKSGAATVYQSYEIKVNEEFDVYIPLWEVDQETLKEATSITLCFKENRKLKVLAVEAAVAGV